MHDTVIFTKPELVLSSTCFLSDLRLEQSSNMVKYQDSNQSCEHALKYNKTLTRVINPKSKTSLIYNQNVLGLVCPLLKLVLL